MIIYDNSLVLITKIVKKKCIIFKIMFITSMIRTYSVILFSLFIAPIYPIK